MKSVLFLTALHEYNNNKRVDRSGEEKKTALLEWKSGKREGGGRATDRQTDRERGKVESESIASEWRVAGLDSRTMRLVMLAGDQ